MHKNKSGHPKSSKIHWVSLGFLFSLFCVAIAVFVRLLFVTLKVTISVADYDIFLAPLVEETAKFTFIFWCLKKTYSMKTSIRLTDALLFGASLGIVYGLIEKLPVLLMSNIQINQGIILLTVILSTVLHSATSLFHSYNAFSLLALRKNLTWNVILFFSAIALHMLFNLGALAYL